MQLPGMCSQWNKGFPLLLMDPGVRIHRYTVWSLCFESVSYYTALMHHLAISTGIISFDIML